MSAIPFTKMEVLPPDVIVASMQNVTVLMEISPPDQLVMSRVAQEVITHPASTINAIIKGFEPVQANIQNMNIQFILSLVGEQGLQGTPGELKATPVTTLEFNNLVANNGLVQYAAYFDVWTKHLHLATSDHEYRSYLAVWTESTPPPDSAFIWLVPAS